MRFSDGALLISLLVQLEDDDDLVLAAQIEESRAEETYFDAVRVGVSNDPLAVRFGRCLWQRQENETPLRLLRLVADRDIDSNNDEPLLRLFQPELQRAQEKVAGLEDTVSALIERLRDADVIDEQTAKAIRDESGGSWKRHVNDFDETGDVNSFF